MPVLHGGLEAVLADGFLCLLVQAHADGPAYGDSCRTPTGVDHQVHDDLTLELGFAGFLGKLRIDLVDQLRVADAIDAG